MESKRKKENICINLNNDEAIVLLDWLSRFNDNDTEDFFEDQSEQRILYDLESVLEKQVSETLQEDYSEKLLNARNKTRDSNLTS